MVFGNIANIFCSIFQGVSFIYHQRNVRSRVSAPNLQVSVWAFMARSVSKFEPGLGLGGYRIDYITGNELHQCHRTRVEHTVAATLLCDVSRDGTPLPLVPCGFRWIVFDNCHNLIHCVIRATVKFISETYTWPNLKKACTVWGHSCVPCQQTKVRSYTKSAFQH